MLVHMKIHGYKVETTIMCAKNLSRWYIEELCLCVADNIFIR